MIDIWNPKTDGHFINDFREKLLNKGFLKEDINVIVENAKDALSKTIDPKNPHQNNETFKTYYSFVRRPCCSANSNSPTQSQYNTGTSGWLDGSQN